MDIFQYMWTELPLQDTAFLWLVTVFDLTVQHSTRGKKTPPAAALWEFLKQDCARLFSLSDSGSLRFTRTEIRSEDGYKVEIKGRLEHTADVETKLLFSSVQSSRV